MLSHVPHTQSLLQSISEQFYLILVNSEGNIVEANDAFLQMTQFSRTQLIGMPCQFFHLEPHQQVTSAEREQIHEIIEGKRADGSTFWMHATQIIIQTKEQRDYKMLWIGSDITQHRKKYERNKRENNYLKQIEEALHLSSIVSIVNEYGKITYVNEHFCKISKYEEHELIGQTQHFLDSGRHSPSYFEEMWQTVKNGEIWTGEICNVDKEGGLFWVHTTVVPFLNDAHSPHAFIFIQADITERKKSVRNDFQRTVRHLQNLIFKYEVREPLQIFFTMIEGQLVNKLQLSTDDLNGLHLFQHLPSERRFQILRYLLRAARGKQVQFEWSYEQYTILIYLSPIIIDGNIVEVVGTGIDITERKEAEETIAYMAYYDALTKLPNRQLLEKIVNEKIKQTSSETTGFTLMFLDLDRFKSVNDSMGHLIGDKLLIAVGERLQCCVRQHDVVARLSGDEYVIVLSTTVRKHIEVVGDRIVKEISNTFNIDNYDIFVTPSIGISTYPKDGTTYDKLLRNADSAMYLAKKSGKNNYQFFTEQLRDEMIEKTLLEMELRKSLQLEQFSLMFQPLFHESKQQIVGVEALTIWNHPKYGCVYPEAFIPIAEDAGLILPVGMAILRKAVIQLKQWEQLGYNPPTMHIKMSTRLVEQPFFTTNLIELVEQLDVNPTLLNLEIKGDVAPDSDDIKMMLRQLSDYGFQLTIGGFGSSPLSFGAMSTLPLSHLKIDSQFIHQLTDTNRLIVETMSTLTKQLNIPLLIDSIRTEEEATFARSLPQAIVQGHYYCPLLTKEQLEERYFIPRLLHGSSPFQT